MPADIEQTPPYERLPLPARVSLLPAAKEPSQVLPFWRADYTPVKGETFSGKNMGLI